MSRTVAARRSDGVAKVVISVTARDIAQGRDHEAFANPIALAARRAFPGARAVAANKGWGVSVYDADWNLLVRYPMPAEGKAFLDVYLTGGTPEPVTLELERAQ